MIMDWSAASTLGNWLVRRWDDNTQVIPHTYRVTVELQISNELFDVLILQGDLPEQWVKFMQS